MAALPVLPEGLAERYSVLRIIGRGGMGVVLEALDLNFKRSVALKLILAAGAGSFNAKGYFAREARSLAAIRHPGVVRVLDGDVAGDTPYLVMELLDGETMHEVTLDERPALATVTGWLDGLLDALGAVHGLGMLHRDLKPSNIFIETSGRPVLIDFGLVTNPDTPKLTVTGTVLGTPRFLAPELIGTGSPTPSADLYALAMSAVEVLIGRSPHVEPGETNTLETVLDSIQTGAYLPRARAELPPGPVAEVLLQALSVHPVERFPDAASMRAALSRAVARGAARSGVVRVPQATRPMQAPPVPVPVPPRRTGATLAAGALIACALVWAAFPARPPVAASPTPAPSVAPSAAPMLSVAEAWSLRNQIHELVIPLTVALEDELKEYGGWKIAHQMDFNHLHSSTRDLKRVFLAERRKAGRAARLDALAREATRVVDAVRPLARRFLATDQPAFPAVQFAFRLADVRECGLDLEVLGTHASSQLVRSWLEGQPETLSSLILKGLLHRSDREHGPRLALLETAAERLDARRLRGPVERDDALAMSMVMMELIDALRNLRPADPKRNEPVVAWWAPWSARFGQDAKLVDVDLRIRSGR